MKTQASTSKQTPKEKQSSLLTNNKLDPKSSNKTADAKSKTAPSLRATATKSSNKTAASKSKVTSASSTVATKAAKKIKAAKAITSNQDLNQVKAIVPSEGIEEQFKGITLLNKTERDEVMRLLQEQNPNPKSELIYHNNFELLCAVVLSAQATDISVNKATPALFAAAPDAQSMAALGADGIVPFIQSIGLWKNKAKFLAQLSEQLVVQYQGQVPDSFEKLTALPGVGSKTAKVVLNVAFGQPCIAVDTHIYRVANRTGLCLGKCPGQVEERISSLIAEPYLKDAHHYLLLHGRYNCTAQRFESHCAHCVLAKYCKHNYDFKKKQGQ